MPGKTLAKRDCVPCRGGVSSLSGEPLAALMLELGDTWTLVDDHRLRQALVFESYPASVNFLVEIARLSDAQGHHPDMTLSHDRFVIEIHTHKIDGLHENDFVLAAKIDQVIERHAGCIRA